LVLSLTFYVSFFYVVLLPPPLSTLFPYTTLFRSLLMLLLYLKQLFLHSELIQLHSLASLTDQFLRSVVGLPSPWKRLAFLVPYRSEEHTSELQSRENLVCRLLLEKKKDIVMTIYL